MDTKIRREFQVHRLNDQGMEKAMELADLFTKVLDEVERLCGVDGRENGLVRMLLETASYYAKREMAQRAENQLQLDRLEP